MDVGTNSAVSEAPSSIAVAPQFLEIGFDWITAGNLKYAGVSEQHARQLTGAIYRELSKVMDPDFKEVGLSVVDLGLVRAIEIVDGQKVKVSMTVTYGYCPHVQDLWIKFASALEQAVGKGNFSLIQQNEPIWNLDNIPEMTRDAILELDESGMLPDFMRSFVKTFREHM